MSKTKELMAGELSLKQQFLLLGFLCFYLIRFYWPMEPWEWALNIAALLIFLPAYFLLFYRPRYSLWCIGIMVFLGGAMAPFNYGASAFIIYATNFAGWKLSKRQAYLVIAASVVIVIEVSIIFHLPWTAYGLPALVVSLFAGNFAILASQQARHLQEQNRQQEEVKRMAVVAERERIGRDLHDLLGHSLSLIHLKSQLCLKYCQTDDVSSLEKELNEIRTVSQDGLKEVRSAVSGYRHQRLRDELQAHQRYFKAANLDMTFDLPALQLPPNVEGELALVVREALTNVMRHANARWCRVTLTMIDDDFLELTVVDNGEAQTIVKGNGLSGLQERMQALHGELSVGVNGEGGRGCKLIARMPWQGPTDSVTITADNSAAQPAGMPLTASLDTSATSTTAPNTTSRATDKG